MINGGIRRADGYVADKKTEPSVLTFLYCTSLSWNDNITLVYNRIPPR